MIGHLCFLLVCALLCLYPLLVVPYESDYGRISNITITVPSLQFWRDGP